MKLFLSLILLFVVGIGNCQVPKQTSVTINTFTKVPDDLTGAGECFYLSQVDKKKGNLICTNDYMTALIYLNGKPIRLKTTPTKDIKGKAIYTCEKYNLIISKGPFKQVGDENYTMKATLTLEYNSKVVWTKNVLGEGGD